MLHFEKRMEGTVKMDSHFYEKNSRGQVLAEYAVMLVMFTAVALLLYSLLSFLSQYSSRILNLLAWEPFT